MNRTLRVIACIALTGCYAYQLAPLTSVRPKDQAHVTTRQGGLFELYDVTIALDTLRGRDAKDRPFWERSPGPVNIPVADIAAVHVRQLDAVPSVAGGIAVVAVLGIVVLSMPHAPSFHW